MQDQQSSPETYTPEQQDQIIKLQRFMTQFKTVIEDWKKSHPQHSDPPIVWSEDLKDFLWMNRAQRRSK